MKTSDQHPNHSKNKKLKAPRAGFHDYRAPGFYFITITAYPDTPHLSVINMLSEGILRKNDMIIPDNTELGECVKTELLRIQEKTPALIIKRYVIMPDHIHFVLQVISQLEKPIGKYLAPFSVACSRAYTNLAGLSSFTTLFKPFDDRIIFDFIQLDRAIKYIEDNPRRYLLRQKYPDLFKRHLHICINNHEYAAYGNIFILKEIYLLPIRIHRYWSQQEFDQYTRKCLEEISKGAIPISPAIHKVEKYIIREAIESGSRVIVLRDLAFNERFKPQGEYFDLCAAGRLLLLSPWPDNLNRRSSAGYTEFHQMNDLAASIASLSADGRLTLRTQSTT